MRWCHLGIAIAAAGALLLAGGCAKSSNVRYDASDANIVWPEPPDEPRIRYVGQIRSTSDLTPTRSFGQTVGDVLLGKQDPVGMVSPLGVCTDGEDQVFIADSNAQVVHVYDLARQRYRQITPPKGAPRFQQPVAVTFEPQGRILVADSAAAVIYAFALDGEFLGAIGEGALTRPCGLAVRRDTREIYIADAGAHTVIVLSPEGQEVRRIGERGTGHGQFNFPTQLTFDSRDRLYVSDSLNFRVQRFGPSGDFERAIGSKGDIAGTFSQPKGIAVDADDHVYVVDANFEAVQVFDADGQLLLAFGSEGHGPGQFWRANGAWFDRTGRLWIADSYNRRVQVFQYLSMGEMP